MWIAIFAMGQCNPWLTVANIATTTITAVIEYNTAPTEAEGIKRIGKRIEENKTIESIVECMLDDSECNC